MYEGYSESFDSELAQMSANLALQRLQNAGEIDAQEGLRALMCVRINVDGPARVAIEAWITGLNNEDGSVSGLALDALMHATKRGLVDAGTTDWILALSEKISRQD